MSVSPLYTAYNRLDEAHRAWHTALNGYHRIEDFRAGVNSAIQSLRNLTFALQKQKDNLADFDNWYGLWQVKMGNDPILKALHTARTVIVHQEDLKLKSTATARTKGWVDFEKMAFEFDPMTDSETIAKGFYDNYAKHLPVSDVVKKRLIFEFERKWVYDKLPDYELLDALARAYSFFYEMLIDATQKFSLPPKESYVTGDYCEAEFADKKTLRCMIITQQERTLTYSFEDGGQYDLVSDHTPPTKEHMEIAQKRYGDLWKSEETLSQIKDIFPDGYPFSQMKMFAKVAVSNLKKDKHLVPMTFIFTENGKPPVMITHTYQNQEEKVISLNRASNEVIKHGGTYVFLLSEAWIVSFDETKQHIPIHERSDRTEVLGMTYLSADKGRNISMPFHKDDAGEIVFEETRVDDFLTNEEHTNYIFLPFIEALKKVRGH